MLALPCLWTGWRPVACRVFVAVQVYTPLLTAAPSLADKLNIDPS